MSVCGCGYGCDIVFRHMGPPINLAFRAPYTQGPPERVRLFPSLRRPWQQLIKPNSRSENILFQATPVCVTINQIIHPNRRAPRHPIPLRPPRLLSALPNMIGSIKCSLFLFESPLILILLLLSQTQIQRLGFRDSDPKTQIQRLGFREAVQLPTPSHFLWAVSLYGNITV